MAKNKDDKNRDENLEPTGETHEGEPIIRDKRRIDPETGDVRDASDAEATAADSSDLDDELQRLIESEEAGVGAAEAPTSGSDSEHLADLKRIQAEYANYRKRVERDRSLARELALADMATSLLPVLDDLDLAAEHGDLPEGSAVALVAEKFRATMERYGLARVYPTGEKFDPAEHEAIAHVPSDAEADTVIDVAVVGYRIGERLLRPAKVVVSAAEE